ncbi:plasmid mobilization protein [Adhaeribacter rhizoryzae]|uniref:Plasmid mobilization relaxosome protein MobC n=1 Tax=Adhaeribacter rhizoryzae TaxID=2607907 RepID=A0A5M6D806_9BACT|nr:hypothetical protein [Adhaeribacter rhizoryzae]KAA5541989.1 hypothetical protein F0145_19575 [Adhaeribacter rhizoryzae]
MDKEEKPVDKKKGRGGRKPKSAKERASCEIHFRVTEEDFQLMDTRFKNSNYKSKTDMYYDIMFQQKLAIRDSLSITLVTEIQNLIREIKAIGTNYNQVVKKINSLTDTRPVPSEVKKLIALTENLEHTQEHFFQIVLKLREKWLQG